MKLFLFAHLFLRQGLAMKLRLALNLLCSLKLRLFLPRAPECQEYRCKTTNLALKFLLLAINSDLEMSAN